MRSSVNKVITLRRWRAGVGLVKRKWVCLTFSGVGQADHVPCPVGEDGRELLESEDEYFQVG